MIRTLLVILACFHVATCCYCDSDSCATQYISSRSAFAITCDKPFEAFSSFGVSVQSGRYISDTFSYAVFETSQASKWGSKQQISVLGGAYANSVSTCQSKLQVPVPLSQKIRSIAVGLSNENWIQDAYLHFNLQGRCDNLCELYHNDKTACAQENGAVGYSVCEYSDTLKRCNARDGSSSSSSEQLPAEFDPRKLDHPWNQMGCIKPVFNQGSCGSCYAVAAAYSFTQRACIYSKGKLNNQLPYQSSISKIAHISPERVLRCLSAPCSGGLSEPALKSMIKDLVESKSIYSAYDASTDGRNMEGCDPYSYSYGSTDNKACPGSQCISSSYPRSSSEGLFGPSCTFNMYGSAYSVGSTWYYTDAESTISNINAVKREIMQNGAIVAYLNAHNLGNAGLGSNKQMQRSCCGIDSTGKCYFTTDQLKNKRLYEKISVSDGSGSTYQISPVNHAVSVIGWKNIDGKDVWIIANSWGSANFGDKGFFYADLDACGLGEFVGVDFTNKRCSGQFSGSASSSQVQFFSAPSENSTIPGAPISLSPNHPEVQKLEQLVKEFYEKKKNLTISDIRTTKATAQITTGAQYEATIQFTDPMMGRVEIAPKLSENVATGTHTITNPNEVLQPLAIAGITVGSVLVGLLGIVLTVAAFAIVVSVIVLVIRRRKQRQQELLKADSLSMQELLNQDI